MRGLLLLVISTNCPSGCKWLILAPHWATCLGAVAILSWLIAMMKRVELFCLRHGLLCLIGPYHHLGLGTSELNFLDPPFLSGAEAARLHNKVAGFGIPNGRLAL